MRSPWRLLATFFIVVIVALCYADLARAQTITVVNEASLPRLNKERVSIQKRSLTLSPEAVNLQDCVDDQLIRFTLQLATFEVNATVQAWASNSQQDCKDEQARGGGTQRCWRVYPSDIPLQTTIDVDIPVRSIMAGAPPNKAADPKTTQEALCGLVNLSTITVQFLYFPPGQTIATQSKTISVTVDTVGPKPPSGLTVLPGNTRIQVQWKNISGGDPDSSTTGGLTELTGVKVFCDAASNTSITTQNPPVCTNEVIDGSLDDTGDAISPDAQTTAQVCVDGGSTTTAAGVCSSANFVNADGTPVFPTADFNAKYECGSITGNTGTTVVASSIGKNPLVNGTSYAVAVAATDKFGNVGELSPAVCETPEITTDFWDEYRKSGGSAGGGCATSGESSTPIGSLSILGLVGVAIAKSIQRRKEKRKGRSA